MASIDSVTDEANTPSIAVPSTPSAVWLSLAGICRVIRWLQCGRLVFGDCDTTALSYALDKIGWPLFEWMSQRWNGIGEAVEAEFLRAERTLTPSHAHRRTAIASYDGRHQKRSRVVAAGRLDSAAASAQ